VPNVVMWLVGMEHPTFHCRRANAVTATAVPIGATADSVGRLSSV